MIIRHLGKARKKEKRWRKCRSAEISVERQYYRVVWTGLAHLGSAGLGPFGYIYTLGRGFASISRSPSSHALSNTLQRVLLTFSFFPLHKTSLPLTFELDAQMQSIHRGQVAIAEMIIGMYDTPPTHRWTVDEFHNVVTWPEEQALGSGAGAAGASTMDDDDDEFKDAEDAEDDEEEEDSDDSMG
ncbi:hypothetical protein LR48_Vigan03g164600 [Vigna angularis]|uniref:Uncharacterized protein n=1 Tax=Phaseolus angularis TaxID=3914 RepID=A0A0L9U743_PHAAN|nr:hypothetical protein LR48_Vigan03g164600 [Vigna angularis]